MQLSTVQRLVDFFNEDIIPVVYCQGSLGASGDLAPLANMCLPLLGLGEVLYKGQTVPAADVLREKGWEPLTLMSKEGLALLNGTQFMSACRTPIHSAASRRCTALCSIQSTLSEPLSRMR